MKTTSVNKELQLSKDRINQVPLFLKEIKGKEMQPIIKIPLLLILNKRARVHLYCLPIEE